MRRLLWVLALVLLVVSALAALSPPRGSVAAFTDQKANPQTLVAAGPPPTGDSLKAQTYKTGDQTSQIGVNLRLVNTGTSQVALSGVTVRYWFTNDLGIAPLLAACYYGCANATYTTETVEPRRDQADRYLQVTYTSGSLAAGADTGTQQLQVRRDGGATPFVQTNDHSFYDRTTFADAQKVTVYVGGRLVWGTEPAALPVSNRLQVRYANLDGNDTDAAIKPGLILDNTSSNSIDLNKVTMRYWFTRDSGADTFQTACDSGCNQVTHTVRTPGSTRPGADRYLEVGFSGGRLLLGSSTGEIRLRLNKTDWSAFDETNDYSHGSHSAYEVWPKVTAYVDGVLVWGDEP